MQLHSTAAVGEVAEQISDNENQKEAGNDLHQIKSPIIGVFYARPNPDAEPFVEVSSKVKKDEPVCIVEAMKLLNEVN